MGKRKPTAADKRHFSVVSGLGCIVCLNNGTPGTPSEIHHPRSLGGMGLKADHKFVLPLCPFHHRLGGKGEAIHAGRKSWEEKFGSEQKLLEQVQSLLKGGRF